MSDAPIEKPRSFLRNLVPTLAFMLVCGVVGPIFLVMGLVVDEPDTGWLLPTGIAITALDVVIAVLVARGRTRMQQRMHRLRVRGRRARARVLSFEQTNVRINDQPVLVLRLRIEGADITPFEVQSRTVVSDVHIPLLHAGELPVLIDPETEEWEIDWASARPVAPVVTATDERPAAERLAELDELLRKDLVSRDEYDDARARILGTL
ncbi:hypothetical protein [Nocardioides sp. LML1-1-1.1]|uniref:hypothetical protein n=1 Tax=Nocardioides sp. LML1-1-1.1 TaxID=3135248 RepID=UPI00343B54BA